MNVPSPVVLLLYLTDSGVKTNVVFRDGVEGTHMPCGQMEPFRHTGQHLSQSLVFMHNQTLVLILEPHTCSENHCNPVRQCAHLDSVCLSGVMGNSVDVMHTMVVHVSSLTSRIE
jgi:hypothetical protein